MNHHLAQAIAIYDQHGIDFQQLLTWQLCHGVMLSVPSVFAIGFCSRSSKPDEPSCNDPDTLFVSYCSGCMATLLQSFNGKFKYVSFQRDIKQSPKLRLWDYQKTLKKVSYGITI